jgi:hypothetical protein
MLIVMVVLRGAVWSRVTGIVRFVLVNGCKRLILIGAPSLTPAFEVVAVMVTLGRR